MPPQTCLAPNSQIDLAVCKPTFGSKRRFRHIAAISGFGVSMAFAAPERGCDMAHFCCLCFLVVFFGGFSLVVFLVFFGCFLVFFGCFLVVFWFYLVGFSFGVFFKGIGIYWIGSFGG